MHPAIRATSLTCTLLSCPIGPVHCCPALLDLYTAVPPYCTLQIPQQQVLLNLHHKTASTSLQIRRGKEPSGEPAFLGMSTGISTAGYIANSGIILKFEAYFKESVDESPLENHRVRKCRILLHLEDSSMKIDEYKQQNSGMLQGTLVKRHRIPYPEVMKYMSSMFGARVHLSLTIGVLFSMSMPMSMSRIRIMANGCRLKQTV